MFGYDKNREKVGKKGNAFAKRHMCHDGFFVFLTGSLGKGRKAALMILEIGGMILLIFEMFSYNNRTSGNGNDPL